MLRAAGCVVVEYPGWRTRTQTDGPYLPRAVMLHHDASPVGPSDSVPAYLADLSHPGAQCWVDTAGRWWLIAAGRMWHAGAGTGWGVIPAGGGNTYSVGVETDHTVGEAWPASQLWSLRRGTRALLAALGATPLDALCGHKEYAPTRKVDPDGLDLNRDRRIAAGQEDIVTDEELNAIADRVWRTTFDGVYASTYLKQVWDSANILRKGLTDAPSTRTMIADLGVRLDASDHLLDQVIAKLVAMASPEAVAAAVVAALPAGADTQAFARAVTDRIAAKLA
jgi:hypothetical protein